MKAPRRRVFAVGFLLLTAAWGRPPATWAQEPPTVTGLELRSDLDRELLEPLESLILLRPGGPFSEDLVRRTLRNLQASGRVGQAAVYSAPDPDHPEGRLAVVALWRSLLVEKVALEGELGLRKARLAAVLDQRPGLPLVEDQVLRGLYQLEILYRRTGFFEAETRLRVSPPDARHRVQVTYELQAGPRWTVGSIGFDGDLRGIAPSDLLEPLASRTGKPYSARNLEEDPEALQRWLIQAGFRKAQVFPAQEIRRPEGKTVDLVFQVDTGPPVEVEVRGAELSRLRKKGLLTFLDEEGYDSALLIREDGLLTAHFQSLGFYRAQVELREEDLGDRILVAVEVDPGPELVLEEVRFEGNEAFSDRQLAALIATQPRQRLRPGSGHLVDEVLEDDVDNLRSFYALQGFWQAEVGEPEVEIDGTEITVVFPVKEGPQRRVAQMEWQGLEGKKSPALGSLTVGGPFHPRRLEEAIENLRSRLRAAGYDQARVEVRQDWISRQLVDLHFEVQRGPRTVLDRVIIRGNIDTRTEVVRRAVGLDTGQPVSRSRLLEVERALARLGIFSRVDVRLSPGEVGRPERDVVVEVEEGRARRASYGLGYDSEDGARGLFGLSHKNLWGRAYSAQLDARVSEKDERYRLIFEQPHLGPWDLPITYSLFQFNEDRESFEQRSLGFRADARRNFRRGRWGLAYDFRIIELQEVDEPIERIDPQDREIEVSSLIPNLLFDRRDDPFDPTDGWSSAFQLQYAFPAFSTDAHFLKLFVQQTGYLPLGSAGVLAASLRLGAIEPLEGELLPESDPGEGLDNPVPIGERFFAGGRTSHRGYERDLLGITGVTRLADVDPDSGAVDLLPVGGNGLFLANLEYRFPILGPLGGTLFLDAGNVWRDWRDFDPDDIRYSAGLGVRYRSPIGPVRLEIGWNLDSQPGEDTAEIHLTFGNPF